MSQTTYPTMPGAWPPQQNGHPLPAMPYQRSQAHQANGTVSNGMEPTARRSSRFRAPTVEEALPVTPLTSILPFSQEILPYPSPSSSSEPSLFANESLRRRTRTQLQQLDREASNNSQLALQSIQKLRQYISGPQITTYDFKVPSNLGDPFQQTRGTRASARLSSFSKMALEKSNIPYRYPTPDKSPSPTKDARVALRSPKSPSRRRSNQQQNGVKKSPKSPKNEKIYDTILVSPRKNNQILDSIVVSPRQENSAIPVGQAQEPAHMTIDPIRLLNVTAAPPQTQQPPSHQSAPNQASIAHDQRVSVVIPGSSQISTPTPTPTPNQTRTFAGVHIQSTPSKSVKPQVQVPSQQGTPSGPIVVLPPLASQRPDYHDFTAAEKDAATGQKRKRDADDPRAAELRIDQRARSEEMLQALEKNIETISYMETALTARDARVDTSFYFMQTGYNEENEPVLTPQAQEKLETSIIRAIDASCFSRVPAEGLLKVQELCGNTLGLVESLTLAVDEGASGEDIEEWLQRVRLTENGLHAARILLRILTAGREDKELYSERSLETISECLVLVMERAIIPIVEIRNSGTESQLFKLYSSNKKPLSSLFNMYGQTLRLLGDLVAKVDVESVVHKVQDLSTKLIFVENGYTDKDSALGTARFEKLRTRAMHVVATIFHRYPTQRKTIFNEIVTSLEKVPVARQSARQFKAHEGKSIQLVSALLMRLVQTSATRSTRIRKGNAQPRDDSEEPSEDGESSGAPSPTKPGQSGDMEVDDDLEDEEAAFDLRKLSNPLYKSATSDATYLIQYLVGRAQGTTKTGDSPYRKLLEIFVEDFLSVLGLPMWPGAEMLLRLLCLKLFQLLGEDKTPVPAKNMALDVLGVVGSGLIDVQQFLNHACRAAETSESSLTSEMAGIARDYLETGDEHQVNKFRGPYRVLMEFLHSQSLNDVQAPSARGLHLTQWACNVLGKDDSEVASSLAMPLRNMIIDTHWLENNYDAMDATITTQQGRLAASIITVASPLGKALPMIMDQLVTFMTSQHSNLKSRSLKSVTELITKDPSILDHNTSVMNSIKRGMQDSSPQVRDSALLLLDKCMMLRPSIADNHVYSKISQLSADESKSVRKHAMKILKEIYLRSSDQNLQAFISAALMARVNDVEANVAEIAQQTFEELWMAPFYKSSRKDAIQREIELKSQVGLIVKTVQRGEEAVDVLDTLLQNELAQESKMRTANLEVCKDMVRLMFDEIIDNEERPDRPSQQNLARALTVFAKAEPALFSSDQLRLLLPYLENLTFTNQMPIFRSVAVIMRHVIPTLSSADSELFKIIREKLLAAITKLQKEELGEAVACLWTIFGVVKFANLVNVTRSALQQIQAKKDIDFKDAANEPKLKQAMRFMMIAGCLGRGCNLDEYAVDQFKPAFPSMKGTSVSALIIDIICPFTRQKYPQALREAALDSVATVCQSWPQHYQRPDVSTAFDLVFRNDDRPFMQIVLSGFLLFFKQEERRSDTGAEIKVGEGANKGTERLQQSFVAGDADAGATTIAQKFLPHILKVARSSIDDLAVTATQVIASINRQGLVHPKDCGPILVVLETSTNATIADIAFAEHKTQHLKHETVFDKHYMSSVQQAFEYQRDVINDPRGVTLQPNGTKTTAPKLSMLFEVLKAGSGKVRKRFLGNLASRMDFELPKLDVSGQMPIAVLYARFLVENLGFFDYVRIDEILHLVSCLEKLVIHGVGTVVAHAIEIEILKVQLPQASQAVAEPMPTDASSDEPMMPPAPEPEQAIRPERLRQLTVASMILAMVWETRTHLRQLWGLAKQNKNGIKAKVTDLNKPASKTPFYRSELLEKVDAIMGALEDPMAQLAQCKAFAEIVAVDSEHRVPGDEEDAEAELARRAAGYETPDEDQQETASNPSSTGKGRKRKGSVGPSGTPSAKRMKDHGTPKKGRGRPKGSLNRKTSKSIDRDDDDY